MHIALVMMSGNPQFSGGVPAVVLERARYLRDQGHVVSIVCRAYHGFTSYEERTGIHIYPIRASRILMAVFHRLQSSSPLFLRALRSGLEAAHRRNKIDLVDLQDGPAILGVGPFVREHAIPMTFTLHGSATVNPGKRPLIGRKLHILYEKMAYRQAARVLAVSAWIARTPGQLGVNDVPCAVIPSPIDETFFNLPRTADPAAPALRLLFLGRIAPEKRLNTALEALALLPANRFRLIVVGDGPDGAAMRAMAGRLGLEDRVEWHGYVRDRETVRLLVSGSHVLLFPTIYEAQGLAVLEGMAAGLLVMASDIDVLAEFIPADHRIPANDARAWASRLMTVEQDRALLTRSEPAMRATAANYRRDILYPRLIAEYETAILQGPRA